MMSKDKLIRLSWGLTVNATVVAMLTMVMVVLLISLDPWHTFLSSVVGLSTYSFGLLITLIFLLIGYASGGFDFTAVRDKFFLFYIIVAACLMLLMLVRFSPVVAWRQICSTVIIPFTLGTLIGLLKERMLLGWFLVGAQVVKLILLVPLADIYFQAYPKRPLFHDEAMYLLFGPGLDALGGIAILLITLAHGRLKILAWMFLPVIAFNLVGLNSRSLLFSSLIIGLLAVFLSNVQRKKAILALLVYVSGVVAFSFLLPGRDAHWRALLGTLLSKLGVDTYHGYVDDSTLIRLDSIRQMLNFEKIEAFGHLIRSTEVELLSFHFFPLVLGFGTGCIGLSLFIILWGAVIFQAVKLAKRPDMAAKFMGMFGLSIALQVSYLGLLFNSQVIFIFFGFFIALPSAEGKSHIAEGKSHIIN